MAVTLERAAERLRAHLADLGRAAGPPWTKDQKIAALTAWVELARLDARDAAAR